ncbi:MAG: class I SAM-dependent methyltransferase [Phycisphaerae bacterium]
MDPTETAPLATFPCHIRAFLGESFKVWRCPKCRTIHCLDVVDLDHYYAKYPFAAARLTLLWRIFYRNLLRRFLRHGMRRHHKLLDYGCGNGLFGTYLRSRGFANYFGYDRYRERTELGDPRTLERGPFDYILLQDVLEHVEDAPALLAEMDRHLAPGGHILVGTPNADRIDLNRPDRFRNEVHAPYHLHIYTRESLEAMGEALAWRTVEYFDRSYHDRPWFGMNTRAAKCYQGLIDGTFDAFFDPFRLGKALRSPRFLFYGVVGYWLSFRSDMSIMFEKTSTRKTAT